MKTLAPTAAAKAPDAVVTIIVNGERRTIPAGSTIESLLASLDLDPRLVVVEHNREILRERDTLAARRIADGDVLEIVHFVGGG